MAERVVRVKLSASVAEYKKAMQEAAESTKKTGDEVESASDKVKAYKDAFNAVGAASVAMGSILSAGLVFATKKFADFDAAMSSVQAATHASANDMDVLRQAALDAGESTVFSATEAAGAIEELAKAGVSTSDILGGGLTGALDLAAAGELNVADAAGIAATALKMFGLSGDQMSHVADLLSAASGKAMGDVDDMAQALNQAGLVANQTGLSIEETTAGLAAFAEQGLLGSDAGTSFKSMLQALNPTSAQAAELVEKYNLSAYDQKGNFIGLAQYAGKLKAGLSGLSTEQQNATLKTIFGADAVRAASVLYKNGAEGIEEWTAAVDDQGYAATTAAIRLDNLKGDIEALGGAFETALIDTGSSANDTLRTMVQAITGLVGMYSDLPAPVQGTATAMGAATAAVALSGGAALLAVPKWLGLKETVEKAGLTMRGIATAGGVAGLALTGLFMIVGDLAAEHQEARAKAEAYAQTLESGTNRITKATREMVQENLSVGDSFLWFNNPSAFDQAEALNISLDRVTDAAMGNVDALKELQVVQKEYQAAYEADKKAGDTSAVDDGRLQSINAIIDAVKGESSSIEESIRVAEQKQKADDGSVESSQSAADAYTAEADAVSDLNSKLTDLIDRINEANGVAQDAVTANSRWLNALDQLSAQAEKNGVSLDENTASGAANAATMADVARAAQSAAEAQLQQDLATMSADEAAKKYAATLAAQKQAFIDSAVSAGYNADQVQALADRIFQMPSEKEIAMLLETAAAQKSLDYFITQNDGRVIRVKVAADGSSLRVGSTTVTPGFSTGGAVRGPGTGTSDSIEARLSNGEYVLTVEDVQRAGGASEIDRWRAARASSELPKSFAAARDSEAVVMALSRHHKDATKGVWG